MPAARISWLASKTVISIARALLSLHHETCAGEGAGSRQRHASARKSAYAPNLPHPWTASLRTIFWCSKPPSEKKNSRHDARNMIVIQFCPSDSFAELTHPAACRSPLSAGPRGIGAWRDLVLCCWKMCCGDRERTRDCDATAAFVAWSVGPGEATRVAGTGVRGTR